MLIPKAHKVAVYSKLFNGKLSLPSRGPPLLQWRARTLWLYAGRRQEAVVVLLILRVLQAVAVLFGGVHILWEMRVGQCIRVLSWKRLECPPRSVACLRSCMYAADGVMVAAEDKNLREHPEVKDVSNLAVLKLMESLTSRQLVRHQFAWKHHYWFLQPDGITHLREFLNLPDYCVPLTHKKQQARPSSRPLGGDDRGGRPSGPGGERGDRPGGFGRGGGRGGDREGYRSKDPSSFGGERPSFGRGREGGGGFGRGGGGRGAPPPQ